MSLLPLYKTLILAKVSSRRKLNLAIKEGKVKVNEIVVKDPLFEVDIKKDALSIANNKIDVSKVGQEDYVYYLLNKPKDYICTVKDTHKRKIVLDLIKDKRRIYPVGRLDKDTEGLLILTNDGNLAHRLTHPKFEIDKIYIALIKPSLEKEDIIKLKKGVYIDKDIKVSSEIKLLKDYRNKKQSNVEVIIHQGIKRQIRRMFDVLGYKVISLRRIKLANLKIDALKIGEFRRLSNEEVVSLKKLVGIKDA